MAVTKIYKQTPVSILKPVFIIYLICIAFSLAMYDIIIHSIRNDLTFYIVMSVPVAFFLIYLGIIPLVIQINYYMNDKGKMLGINNERKFLVFYHRHKEQIVKYEDIHCIIKIHANNRIFYRHPWMHFYYYQFVLKTGVPIQISRFTVEHLEEKIDSIKIIPVVLRSIPLIAKEPSSYKVIN